MNRKPLPGAPAKGLTGALGGITNIGQLVELLRPHFLPQSIAQPPKTTTNTGNRSVLQYGQQVTLAFQNGAVVWTFSPAFNANPICTCTPLGAPTGTPAIYISAISPQSVTFKSTNAADARQVHLTATGNPN